MADAKSKVKGKIDDAAHAGKVATDKVADKAKQGAKAVGEGIKDAGQKVKDAAK